MLHTKDNTITQKKNGGKRGSGIMRFLLFDGGTVETLEYFSKCIARELREAGEEVLTFQVDDETTELPKLIEYIKQGDAVLITFNFHGIQHEAIFYTERNPFMCRGEQKRFGGILGGKQLLWDKYQVLCVNIVVDHPLYYYKELKDLPERYMQLCIDKGHEDYMRRYYPQIALGKTLPLAGSNIGEAKEVGEKTETDACGSHLHDGKLCGDDRSSLAASLRCNTEGKRRYLPIADRTMGVSFVGNYTPPRQFEQYIIRLGEEYEEFYRDMLDDFIAHPWKETHEVFAEHSKQAMGELSAEEQLLADHNLLFLDLYIRFFFRGEVVRLLTEGGIVVHAYGAGWDLLDTKRKELLSCNGSRTSAQCLEVLADTKLSLNVMPWFKQGAHDRIYSSMYSGAVSVTDTSRYLKQTLSDGKNVVFYELSELSKLPETVHMLLAEEDRLQQIADAAYAYAAEQHTWKQYTKELLSAILSL